MDLDFPMDGRERAARADPDGTRAFAVQVRDALLHAGFACDELWEDSSGWNFLVEPTRTPIGVNITCRPDADGDRAWHVSAEYDGGLSSLWGIERRREATVLLRRIEDTLREHVGLQ
jgi:hypothetical protein